MNLGVTTQEQASKSLVDRRRGKMERFPLLFSSDSERDELDDDSLDRQDRMAEERDWQQRAAEINPATSPGTVTGNGGAVHARAHIGRVGRPPNVSVASTPHSADSRDSPAVCHDSISPTPVQRRGASAYARKAPPPWIPNGKAPVHKSILEKSTKKLVSDCLNRIVDQEIEVHIPRVWCMHSSPCIPL